MTRQHPLLALIRTQLEALPGLQAAWLGGSYGRGEADAYSDLDIGAYAASPDEAETLFQSLQDSFRRDPLILFFKTLPQSRTINLIATEWERADITLYDPAHPPSLPRQAAVFLFDRAGIERLFPETIPAKFDKAELQNVVEEFIRVLGLLPIALGREDYVTAQTGAQLLRDFLIRLMFMENHLLPRRGVLSLRKALTEEHYQIVQNLPPLLVDRNALLKAHAYLAQVFFTRGKKLCLAQKVSWPEKFATAATENVAQKTRTDLFSNLT